MPYSPLFEQAFQYAHRWHAPQMRKAATHAPYITHLMSVAGIVADYGGDEDQVIAALLHDVVEDQGGEPRLVEIREQFGERIAEIVDACTDARTIPKPPWRERKEAYIAHLAKAPEAALLVVAADKLHNSRALVAELRLEGNAAFEKFNGKQAGTLWYYREVVTALKRRGSQPLFDELERTVRELHALTGEPWPAK